MEIPCRIIGGPIPSITWYRDGVSLSNNDKRFRVLKSGSLVINEADDADEGAYICKGENIIGSVQQTTALKMLSKDNSCSFTVKYFIV